MTVFRNPSSPLPAYTMAYTLPEIFIISGVLPVTVSNSRVSGMAVGTGVAVGAGVGVAVSAGVGVAVSAGVGVAVGTGVGVAVGTGVGVGVGTGVGVAVGVVPPVIWPFEATVTVLRNPSSLSPA